MNFYEGRKKREDYIRERSFIRCFLNVIKKKKKKWNDDEEYIYFDLHIIIKTGNYNTFYDNNKFIHFSNTYVGEIIFNKVPL